MEAITRHRDQSCGARRTSVPDQEIRSRSPEERRQVGNALAPPAAGVYAQLAENISDEAESKGPKPRWATCWLPKQRMRWIAARKISETSGTIVVLEHGIGGSTISLFGKRPVWAVCTGDSGGPTMA
jgi:hypothetical protein